MPGHFKKFDDMIMLTVLNPAYARVCERFLISIFNFRDARCTNRAAGGERVTSSKGEMQATYVYVVRKMPRVRKMAVVPKTAVSNIVVSWMGLVLVRVRCVCRFKASFSHGHQGCSPNENTAHAGPGCGHL